MNPATRPITKANAHSDGVNKLKNMSIPHVISRLRRSAREILNVILNQIDAAKRIFIVLHLRKGYAVLNQTRELTDGT